jgi:hypothetical protein
VRVASAVLAAVLLAIASPAYAEEAEPAPPASSAPEHAGLYLQGSAGAAYWSSDIHNNETGPDDATIEGWGAAYGIRVGWTWTGFTLGFGVEGRTIWAETHYYEGSIEVRSSDGTGRMTALGPSVDWYVFPREGFHLGVMPGAEADGCCEAWLNITVWAGYDIPIGAHWWVGVEPRYFGGGAFFGSSSSREILLTATYNLPSRYVRRAKGPGSTAPARGYDPRTWRR